MLIFGGSVGDWREKAAYAEDKADNDFAAIREVRCEGIEDVPTAMAFMAALANDSKCKEFLYHATVNLFRGERLATEQWFKIIGELEKRLGLEGHYRIAFEHIKKDRQHYHIYWSRLPTGNGGPAVNMGNNYRVHDAVAMHFENEFGLKPAPRKGKNKPSHKRQEIKDKNAKIRVNPDAVTKEVTEIYHTSESANDFVRNLDRAGYTLTRSQKNKLVLVDRQGGYHGLIRRIDGVGASGLRQKFPDLEAMALLSLTDVLRSRRPPSMSSFRKTATSLSRKSMVYSRPPKRSGHNPFVATPRLRSLASIMAEARIRYRSERQQKHYPPPIMRKRRPKKAAENKLARGGPTKAEIESAALLAWAWENHRIDVLYDFGIIVLPKDPTLYDLVQYGLVPPDALEL